MMSSTFFVGKVNRACNGGRLAGCGPCGRPPLQGKQFPIWSADGHKGRTLQMADDHTYKGYGRPQGMQPANSKSNEKRACSSIELHALFVCMVS